MTTNSHKTMQLHVRRYFRSEYLILREAVKVIHVVHVAARRVPSIYSHILPAITNCQPRFWVMVRPRLQKITTNGLQTQVIVILIKLCLTSSYVPLIHHGMADILETFSKSKFAIDRHTLLGLSLLQPADMHHKVVGTTKQVLLTPRCTVQCFPTANQE